MPLKVVWNPFHCITADEPPEWIEGHQFDPSYVVTVPDVAQDVVATTGEIANIRPLDSGSRGGEMLRIHRSSSGQVVYALSGQLEGEHISELERLIDGERSDRPIVLDLKDLTLAGREAINFFQRRGD